MLAAGALCSLLLNSPALPDRGERPGGEFFQLNDPVKTTLSAWQKAKANLFAAVSGAENAQRLLAIPELRDDVAYCLQPDVFALTAQLDGDGVIRISI